MLSPLWSDVVGRSKWWTLTYLLCMVLWWTQHHRDLWGTLLQRLSLTWLFSSVLGGHCYICSVWCLDEYTTTIFVDRTLDAHFSWRKPSDVFLQAFHCEASCYTDRTVTFQGILSPYHQDQRGSRWHMMIGTGGSHPRVSSLSDGSQSSSLCCTQLHLLCVFMWWTRYHHNLWRRRSFKFLRWNDEIFCV